MMISVFIYLFTIIHKEVSVAFIYEIRRQRALDLVAQFDKTSATRSKGSGIDPYLSDVFLIYEKHKSTLRSRSRINFGIHFRIHFSINGCQRPKLRT